MSPSTGAERTTGRVVAAAVLAIVAIAFLVVGIVFCVEPAGSLPGWLGHETIMVGGKMAPSPGHHPLRAVGSLIAGAVFAIGAWFSFSYQAPSAEPAAGTAETSEQAGTTVTPAR